MRERETCVLDKCGRCVARCNEAGSRHASEKEPQCLCTQALRWVVSDKGNAMCHFVSLHSRLLPFLHPAGGGWRGGEGREGEAVPCPRSSWPVWAEGSAMEVVALPGSEPASLLCSRDEAISPGLRCPRPAGKRWLLRVREAQRAVHVRETQEEFRRRVKYVEESSFT